MMNWYFVPDEVDLRGLGVVGAGWEVVETLLGSFVIEPLHEVSLIIPS